MTQQGARALQNALASARMEGLPVTAQTEQDCIRYLEGRVDTDALVREILARRHRINQRG